REVHKDVEYVFALRPGDLGDTFPFERSVFLQLDLVDIHHVPALREGARNRIFDEVIPQPLAYFRVTELLPALFHRQKVNLLPVRHIVKNSSDVLQRKAEHNGAATRLRIDRQPLTKRAIKLSISSAHSAGWSHWWIKPIQVVGSRVSLAMALSNSRSRSRSALSFSYTSTRGLNSKKPRPNSPTALHTSNSSWSSATLPGIGSPWSPTCTGERETDSPAAPARMPWRTSSFICSTSARVAWRSIASLPMTYRRIGECPIRATRLSAGLMRSTASRYSGNVVHVQG